jgi:hypothetical protein
MVDVAYTDVHRSRIRFLQEMLQPFAVTWTTKPPPEGVTFDMVVGRYAAVTPAQIERYLAFVGSRLVFLIDWNRARKRLAVLVGKSEAVALLKWAADNNLGHCAFLQIGGIRLVEVAFERAAPMQARLGSRLDERLGRQAARHFLMTVLRATSAGLSAGQSTRLIEDKIEADLLRHLQTPERHVLAGAAGHATMIAALAEHLRLELMRRKAGGAGEELARTPALARAWTARADEMLRQECRFIESINGGHQLGPLLSEAEGAAAALEETASMLPFIPEAVDPKTLALLESLGDQVSATAREYVRGLETGQELSPASERRDVDDFLIAIDRLAALGREAVDSKRALTEHLLRSKGDCHELYVLTTMAHGFERTAALLARCGSIVRDQVLRSRLMR